MGFYATETLEAAPLRRASARRARRDPVCCRKPLRGPTRGAISGYRYYSPRMGRWINRDPIGERDGRNLYIFSVNAPGNFADILGLGTFEIGEVGKEKVRSTGDVQKAYDANPDGFSVEWTPSAEDVKSCPSKRFALIQIISRDFGASSLAGIATPHIDGGMGKDNHPCVQGRGSGSIYYVDSPTGHNNAGREDGECKRRWSLLLIVVCRQPKKDQILDHMYFELCDDTRWIVRKSIGPPISEVKPRFFDGRSWRVIGGGGTIGHPHWGEAYWRYREEYPEGLPVFPEPERTIDNFLSRTVVEGV